MFKKAVILFLASALFCGYAGATDKFPFVAEITADNTNVRAGQNVNFEKLYVLKKGDLVTVVEKNYTWYKIVLAPEAKCFINKSYVKIYQAASGVVTGNRVNLRAGPGPNYTALGQLMKDDVVEIISETNGWYQIKPAPGTFGWISEQFLVYKSQQVPEIKEVMKAAQLEESLKQSPPAPVIPPVEKAAETVLLKKTGRIEPLESLVISQDIQYKLIVDDQELYLLEIPPQFVDRFSQYTVDVFGIIKPDSSVKSSIPILKVSKVEIHL